jgi:hypothetical protein
MSLKGSLTVLLIILAWPVIVAAQGMGDLTIRSDPAGAQVRLTGDLIVSGVSPVRFNQILVGSYKLEVKKRGYENYSGRLVLDPSKVTDIGVTLSPKTRFKAAARSLFIPGWGQRYSDQKFRGNLFTLLAAASVVAYFVADDDFDYRYDNYNRWLDRYDDAAATGAIGQLADLQIRLDEAQEKAYDAENVRRVAIGSAIAVWSLSVLDALLFMPQERATFSIKGVGVKPATDFDKISLTLSKSF